jgi:hypothetical protein
LLGGLAILLQAFRKKLTPPEWGLLAGMAVWSLVACRYVCVVSIGGSHYVVLGSVVAAHAAAGIASDLDLRGRFRRWSVPLAGSAVLATTLLTFVVERRQAVPTPDDRRAIELGRALSHVATAGDLVVVRSTVLRFDEFWGAPLNFEDPRPFYLSHTHGWVLPADEASPTQLEHDLAMGARYYVEPHADKVLGTLEPWLRVHASLVARTADGGRIFRLAPP